MKTNKKHNPTKKSQLACFGYYDLLTDKLKISYTALLSDFNAETKALADKAEKAAKGQKNIIFAWAIHRKDCKIQMGVSAFNLMANLADTELQQKIYSKLFLFVMKNHDAFDGNKPFAVLDNYQVN